MSCISTFITRNRQFRGQSFLKHEFILVLKASLTISLVEKKPTSRDSSSKWDVVDGKIKNLSIQYILILAMSLNFETSVIINETTTIKLIELNKKYNYNVFATAIYGHSRILLRTDNHFPVKCLLNQF